ncbi:uncharacterized protein LOC127585918 [Pristis pectinata]|uniref:uncharacterized protein LOC127585918 n=1 Tax=Pristis pectinata TaxID=685728 RepID=UPI00223DEA90|nr:uncharacterized protein LOC127585918 [Pristis pectinata]
MRLVTPVLFVLCFLQVTLFEEIPGFNIKNVRLDKCIHANSENNRVSLTECNQDSKQQHWRWDSRLNYIVSLKTNQCLTVHKPNEFGAVKLEPCGGHQPQAWKCSKRGHLTLEGYSLHLNVKHKTNKIHVSREKGKLNKWRTLKDEIICTEINQVSQHEGNRIQVSEAQTENVEKSTNIPMTNYASESFYSMFENFTYPKENDKTVTFKYTDGTTWKIVMVILGGITLTLGIIVLILNITHDNKKLKAGIVADPDEKTSLTTGHKLRHDASRSPSLRHGEILIEWKDGKITSLFDDN